MMNKCIRCDSDLRKFSLWKSGTRRPCVCQECGESQYLNVNIRALYYGLSSTVLFIGLIYLLLGASFMKLFILILILALLEVLQIFVIPLQRSINRKGYESRHEDG